MRDADADNAARMMIDCGHHGDTGWQPGSHLVSRGIRAIDMLAITNFDEDHVSGFPNLKSNVDVRWIRRNGSVTWDALTKIKGKTGGAGTGVTAVFEALKGYTVGAPPGILPVFQGLEEQQFCVAYPTLEDTNNLSLALFLKCHGVGVMFTGDLGTPGFAHLLREDAFKLALMQTHIFIAPHHGREDGCCDELVPFLKNVVFVVISDKAYEHETQETYPFYRGIAQGERLSPVAMAMF